MARVTTAWSRGDAERWLAEREPLGMSFGLERMEHLMAELGSPQRRFRSIHVVGTNGKSSTVRMTAALLRRHGVRTGAYISPHLVRFEERVELDERPVSEDAFSTAVASVACATERIADRRPGGDQVTQFEALTAAAYVAFAQHGVEVAVVEAGLGGRLDATSVISSHVQVLTSVEPGPHRVARRHRVADRRREAGRGLPGWRACPWRHARRRRARPSRVGRPPPRRAGQRRRSGAPHRAGVFRAVPAPQLRCRRDGGDRPDWPSQRRSGAGRGRQRAHARPPARHRRGPLTVLDAAHNPEGIAALIEALPGLRAQARGDTVVAVVSVLADKDAGGMLHALVPHCDRLVLTANSSSRALNPSVLKHLVRELGTPTVVDPEPGDALIKARLMAGNDGLVLVTGSIVLVGDLIGHDGGEVSAA